MRSHPVLLFIGGHDPTGGAGLQADLETAAAHHCHATSLVTCLTTQDTHNVHALRAQPVTDFERQLDCLLADIRPNLVKIGLLGDADIARSLGQRLADLSVPVVLDPVLAAGGGMPLANSALIDAICHHILPVCKLITPNREEARRLGGPGDARSATQALCAKGPAVLLTGTDDNEADPIVHYLHEGNAEHRFTSPRLEGRYHGSGCTLAAACACRLARGATLPEAVSGALDWTRETLRAAVRLGSGQRLPRRLGSLRP